MNHKIVNFLLIAGPALGEVPIGPCISPCNTSEECNFACADKGYFGGHCQRMVALLCCCHIKIK